jgi:hypothetical protein
MKNKDNENGEGEGSRFVLVFSSGFIIDPKFAVLSRLREEIISLIYFSVQIIHFRGAGNHKASF